MGRKLRTDLRDGLLAFLVRLVRRSRGGQTVKLMPALEARTWRRDAAEGKSFRPPSSRTIQSWRSRLVDLGLIDAIDYGQFWVIRFRFSIQTMWSVLELKKGGKVSDPSLLPKGDSPKGNPPYGSEDPSDEAGPAAALEAAQPADHEQPLTDPKVEEATRGWRDEIRKMTEQLAQASLSKRRNRSWTESERRQKEWEAERLRDARNSRTAKPSGLLTRRNGSCGPKRACDGHAPGTRRAGGGYGTANSPSMGFA